MCITGEVYRVICMPLLGIVHNRCMSASSRSFSLSYSTSWMDTSSSIAMQAAVPAL